ncbi:Pyridoxal-phosphate dependent enzyme [Carpediemonas membranifera]|uniref:Pyridoxal-phosphate dependent enzyme n=1 Tax=Carpediemonas membranifera TaxID=201153 RepID=A0A8J6AZG9_9EUKA|nr:Pyridoxal-phosphate dependent enzyme [Carpediemonas membranifera]|eukprot:KAG9389702.1 Pyridoxal-phosphate dependent enzyme [Carpediemonas membranifera]
MSLDLDNKVVQNNIKLFQKRGILLPTLDQMVDPSKIPQEVREALMKVDIEETNPLNLFRITWKNDGKTGGFRDVPNFVELPSSLTGTKARMVLLAGKYFPTGAHKVGATFCALVDHLTTGRFDPEVQEAMWPSTGNYCRGGAFDSCLLGCKAVALLPEEMSQERFDYLRRLGAEVFGTPGCESNVKEIFDKAKELCGERGENIVNFNQFEQLGNPAWHKFCTGRAVEEVFNSIKHEGDELAGYFSMSGSAGTIGASEHLREVFPHVLVGVGEPEQCPVLTENGFGGHRIEGVGDKHVPWVHNVKNMDFAAQIDDDLTVDVFRMCMEPVGREYLRSKGRRVHRRGHRAPRHLWLRQSPWRHQDGQVLRADRERRRLHHRHRLEPHVHVPPRGVHQGQGPLHPRRRRRHLRPPHGHAHRGLRRDDLRRAQARPQPQVLHLRGAAGQDRRGAQRPVVRPQLLAARARYG